VAVRYPRGGEGAYTGAADTHSPAVTLRQGSDCTIVTYGVLVNQALAAAELLEQKGIRAEVVKLNRISPLTEQETAELLGSRRCLLVLEDSLAAGCVGERLEALLAQAGCRPDRLILRNLGGSVPDHGSTERLYERCGLDSRSLAETLEEALQ